MLFVHIADDRDAASIKRNGLKLPRKLKYRTESDSFRAGVFAMPVIGNFQLTYQWVRELKRRGHRTACGVYFRLKDDEPVWAGRYNKAKERLTAGEAARRLLSEAIAGYEVIVPRDIAAKEIQAIRPVPQTVGWRYYPEAKGRHPCGCAYCLQRGEIKSRKIRAGWQEG